MTQPAALHTMTGDSAGTYIITHDTVALTDSPTQTSHVLGTVAAGDVVVVEEVVTCPEDGRVYGRAQQPQGWIALCSADGFRWASKQGPGPIVMHGLLDQDRIGLSLSQELVVTRLVDPKAAYFGWCMGDKVLQVNGVPVTGEDDFLDEVHRATIVFKEQARPLVFDIARAPPPTPHGSAHGHFKAAPLPGHTHESLTLPSTPQAAQKLTSEAARPPLGTAPHRMTVTP